MHALRTPQLLRGLRQATSLLPKGMLLLLLASCGAQAVYSLKDAPPTRWDNLASAALVRHPEMAAWMAAHPSVAEDSAREDLLFGSVTGRGIAISGGGYRAMLFGLGSLWRLNELGMLSNVERISSVSGGSILAAYLAVHWKDLVFVQGSATNFDSVIAAPILKFANSTIDWQSVFAGALIPGQSASSVFARTLDRKLFSGKRLSDISNAGAAPDFSFYSTNYASGDAFVFGRERFGPWVTPGLLPSASVRISDVVAASAAFPPFLAPANFKFEGYGESIKRDFPNYPQGMGFARSTHDRDPMPKDWTVSLVDGGLSDNLGSFGCAGARFMCISVDSATFPKADKISSNWLAQMTPLADALFANKERWIKSNLKRNEGAVSAPFLIYAPLAERPKIPYPVNVEMIKYFAKLVAELESNCDVVTCDPNVKAWAVDVLNTWNQSVYDRRVEVFMSQVDTEICQASIPTRLAKVRRNAISSIVNLGYLAADRELFYVANNIVNWPFVDGPSDPRFNQKLIQSASRIREVSPLLLTKALKLPLDVEIARHRVVSDTVPAADRGWDVNCASVK